MFFRGSVHRIFTGNYTEEYKSLPPCKPLVTITCSVVISKRPFPKLGVKTQLKSSPNAGEIRISCSTLYFDLPNLSKMLFNYFENKMVQELGLLS